MKTPSDEDIGWHSNLQIPDEPNPIRYNGMYNIIYIKIVVYNYNS